MCLRVVTFSYLVMRVITLIEYQDANISSFEVMENRFEMQGSLSLADLNIEMFFGFMHAKNFRPVTVDPKIGHFEL